VGVAGTAANYRLTLAALLPDGPVWPQVEVSVLQQVLAALGVEMARAHQRVEQLIEEADPHTTNDLITDWERLLGLPDDCLATPPTTLAERRAAIVTLLTLEGRQDETYFISVAASLGYTVTITYPLAHTFRVNAPAVTITAEFTCVSPCTEPLRTWGNEVLECAIKRLKPAHVAVQFAYA